MPSTDTIFPPGTVLKLLRGVPLDNTYRDTRDWASQQAQIAWFSSKVKVSYTDFTYQRQAYTVRVPTNAENIYDCNYMMYQNASYGVKWFFAFITQIDYVNDVTTEICFELDVMQTWYFDFKVNPCFVEREHVNDDTPGKHLIDEGLALGDYVTNASTFESFQDFYIVVGSTVSLTGNFYPIGGGYYGGIYSGVRFYAYSTQASGTIDTLISQLAQVGKADAIVCMYELPVKIASRTSSGSELQGLVDAPGALTVPNNRTLDGYTPRNGKLYTYPYQCIVMTNHDGGANTYRYEFFAGSPVFSYVGGLQPNSRLIAYPEKYKGITRNFNESLSLGNYPQSCWQKDLYGQWLATSQARWGYQKERNMRNMLTNLGASFVNNAGRGVAGLSSATDTAISEINKALDIQSSMREENEVHSMIPNSVSGTIGNGYTQISFDQYGFLLEAKSITNEIARSIDGYFDMFGYKVNALKAPNITGRKYWNFVKTIKASITGSLPVDAIGRIRNIFDKGITFWHGDWVGNYSLDNSAGAGVPDPPNPPDPPPDPPEPPDPSEPTGAIWGVPFPDWASHVTSEYGPRINPITGVSEVHEGIDIAYPIGTPIAAIAAGTCIRNTSSTGRGKYGTVQVNETYLYIYQHCSAVNMRVGDTITLGQADVARVGDTGYVTGPHLHLEIWANGTPVNPRPFLEGQFNPQS